MREGLTYDDVLLIPKRSSVRSRKEIDTSTKLSRHIDLHIPIVAANMDTVTEHRMAIVMAQQGGIGIIHRFMSIADQVNEVNKVKRSEMIRIDNPYCLSTDVTLKEANDFMEEKGISGILVVDEDHKLKGILTSRDIKFAEDEAIPIKELMSTDLVTAQPDITIEEAKTILKKHRIEKLPLVDEKGTVKGLITATDIIKAKVLPKASKDSKGRLRVGAAIGVVGDYLDRAKALIEADADVLVLDIAHGHSDLAINAIKEIRKNFGDVELIAGNVATAEGTKDLIEAGSDGIKVGVGPGSICFEEDALVTMGDYSVKKIKDIMPGEYVITHKNKKRMVTKTYKRSYTGEILEIEIKGSPRKIKVTPEHPILAISLEKDELVELSKNENYFDKEKYNKELDWIDAKDLKEGDIVVIPRTIARKTMRKTFDLTEYSNCFNNREKVWEANVGNNTSDPTDNEEFNETAIVIPAHQNRIINTVSNEQQGTMLISNKTQNSIENNLFVDLSNGEALNRFIKLDDKLMKLFGYFMSRGYFNESGNGKHLYFSFYNNEMSVHNEVRSFIEEIFDYNHTQTVLNNKENKVTLEISSKIISSFFERIFPLDAKYTKIPSFITEQEKELLAEFVKGLLVKKDVRNINIVRDLYTTLSPSFAFQLSEILVRLGFIPSVKEEKKNNGTDGEKEKVFVVNIPEAQYKKLVNLVMSDSSFDYRIESIDELWYDEEYIYTPIITIASKEKRTSVYNLEVDDDNSYLVNRIAVHNCITRIVAGAGVPQLTAVMDASKVAREYDVPIIADGGIRTSGDIAKAIVAGAQTVMIGSLLAGTEESPGTAILRQGRRYKVVRGMASLGATLGREAKEKKGSFDDLDLGSVVPEGVEAMVPYRGSAVDVLNQLVGGLRSGVSYCGASNLKEMQEKGEFIKITSAGIRESSSHDVEPI